MARRRIFAVLSAGALAATGMTLAGGAATALPEVPVPVCGTQPSIPAAQQGWGSSDPDIKPATYVSGPAGADGAGSLELKVNGSTDHVGLFHQSNIKLSDLDGLGYRQTTTGAAQASYQLILNGTTSGAANGFTTLVYEPVYNGEPLGTTNGWKDENAQGGKWWSTRPIAGAPNRDTFVPLSDIVANNPDATVVAYGVSLGSGVQASTSNVDDVRFGCTTWNFEPNPSIGGSIQ